MRLSVSSSGPMWKQAQPSAEMHTLNSYSAQDGLDIKHSYPALSNHLQQHHHLITGTFITFQLFYWLIVLTCPPSIMPLHLTVFQDKQDYLLSGIHSNEPVFQSLTLCSFAANIIGIISLLTERASSANTSRFHNRYGTNPPHYQIR